MISPEELADWINVRALAGKEACQRIRARIEARTQLPVNVTRMPRGRR
jgi:hypothetical protein